MPSRASKHNDILATYGRYSIFWADDRGRYYARYYNAVTGGSRRKSTGTRVFDEACRTVNGWVAEEYRIAEKTSKKGPRPPSEVYVGIAITNYLEDVISKKPYKAQDAYRGRLTIVAERFGDHTVDQISNSVVGKWVETLQTTRGISYNGAIDYAMLLKAAIRNEYTNNRLQSVPYFASTKKRVELDDIERQVELPPKKLAAYLDVAASYPHFFRALILAFTTGCRMGAALDFVPHQQVQWQQEDSEMPYSLAYLNPPGRTQTDKRRPRVPMVPTLEIWIRDHLLRRDTALANGERPQHYFVEYRGKPVEGFNTVQRRPKQEGVIAGNPFYTVRHSWARAVLARGAPIEQREGMLGHVAEGQAGPYGFWLPLNAHAVRDATELWLQEINAHCKRVDLTDPSSLDRAAEEAKRETGRRISRNRWKK